MRRFLSKHTSLVVLAVLGIAGLLVALSLRDRSFPVATIDFEVLSPEAESQAREFLADRGLNADGYRAAVGLSVDDTAKNFVHRFAGLEGLNRLAQSELVVWRWHVRFYRELRQEEYSVYITPEGRLSGFSHTIPEAQAGASPTLAEAQRLAETFLADGVRDLSAYRLVSASASRRDARLDHLFTWERTGYSLEGATARIDVWTQGEEVGGFHEYLKVPEEWRRGQAIEANRGNVLAVAGWALTYGLGLVMAFVVLVRLRAGRVSWRFAAGLALLMTAIGVATGLNSVPLLMLEYPTTESFSAYLVRRLTAQAGSLIPGGLAVVLAGVGGDYLYGRLLRDRLRPSELFSRRGLVSREFVHAVGAGYAIAGIWLGFVTVFYSVGQAFFGAWSPAEVPYRDLMTTVFPWLYPLTVGFGAAISEELMFRLFAAPFFVLLAAGAVRGRVPQSRSSWPVGRARVALVAGALVLPAAIWGSLHSTYPQQPFFVRALELTIVGTVSALIMFRFGILAPITAHYVYNASVIGGLFVLSGNPYLQVSAVVVIALPLLALLPAAARWRRGQLLDDSWSHQAEEEVRQPPQPVPSPPRWLAYFPGRRRVIEWLLVGAVCLSLVAWWQVPRFGDLLRTEMSPEAARQAAAEVAGSIGVTPGEFVAVTTFADWSHGSGSTYLLRRLGTVETNRYLAQEVRPYLWQTRFVRPLHLTELFVRYDVNGGFSGLDLRLPEDAPGANLTQAEALAVAETFVRERGRAEALEWERAVSSSERRKNRTDHAFEWENTAGRIDELAPRLRVSVKGDTVGEYLFYLRVPEAFERELARRTAADVALSLVRDGLPLAVMLVGVVLFVVRFVRWRLDLRFAAAAAGLMAILDAIGHLNGLPTFFAGYWTTIDREGYVAWRVVDMLRALGGDTAWRFVLFAVGESLFRDLLPRSRTISAQARALLRPGPAEAAAAATGLATAPVFLLLLAAYRAAREAFAPGSLTPEGTIPGYLLDVASPYVAIWQVNLSFSLWLTLGGLSVSLWLWRVTRRGWLFAVVWALGLTVLYMGRLDEWERLVVEAVRWLVFVGIVYVLARRYARSNLMAYGLAVFTTFAARDALFLYRQPEPTYATAGLIALVGGFVPSLWLLLAGVRRGWANRFDSRLTHQ